MAKQKGQASLEYLMIVGIAFVVMVPTMYFFFSQSEEKTIEMTYAQMEAIGRNIVHTSERLYFAGTGSKTILEINLPEEVQNAKILGHRELVFNVSTLSGFSDFVFFSRVNLTTGDSCAQVCVLENFDVTGLKTVRILALNNSVLINETS